jgi:outer membrane protein assembly factor BamB
MVLVVGLAGVVEVGAGEIFSASGNWAGWRGDGSGVSSEKHLPVFWSEKENVVWRTELPGEGNSSPVVWGNQIFLTASLDEGAKRFVLCLDAQRGKILWQTELKPEEKTLLYPKTGFAAPTPVTDGRRVYVFFDTPGVVALDLDGKVIWTRSLGPFQSPYNVGTSPVLYKDMVIQCCDHHGKSFVVALGAERGEERWRTPRPSSSCGHFGTPLLIQVGGRTQLVCNGEPVAAYDPDTGRELWSCRGMKECVGPSPVFGHGLLYASSGRTGPVMAIDPTGQGDVTETHVRMHAITGGPYVPTPVVYPHLLVPGDNGRMMFYNGRGKLVVEGRVRDHFTSSPVAADGKIYWPSERGKTYVIDASGLAAPRPAVKVLAVNQIRGVCLASPAIAHGQLLLRTNEALYCIAERGKALRPSSEKVLSGTFAELKKRYDDHVADWKIEPLAQIRLETMEAIARLDDPEVIPFLLWVAVKEPHWDICEEAAKCLGRKGVPAIDSLVTLVPDTRPFIRTIAIVELGRLRATKAIPGLLLTVHDKQQLVRSVGFEAMAQIGQQPTPELPKIVAAMVAAAGDRLGEEAVVRESALDGLAALAPKVSEQRAEVIDTLAAVARDRNPRLARKAQDLLDRVYKAPPARTLRDDGTYQNGGYWATPLPWLMATVMREAPARAARLFCDAVEDFQVRKDINEWVNDNAAKPRGVRDYCASAAMPLAGVRRLRAYLAETKTQLPPDLARRLAADETWLKTEAKRVLRGSSREGKGGVRIFTPDATGGYGAFWVRDWSYAIEGSPQVFSRVELRDGYLFLAAAQRADGCMPDRVAADGHGIFSPGGEKNPLSANGSVDQSPFMVIVCHQYWKLHRDLQPFRKTAGALEKAMRFTPRNPANGLVHITDAKQFRPYSFLDTVPLVGDQQFDSVLFWDACQKLAEMFTAAGEPARAEPWRREADRVKASMASLWDEKLGLFVAASVHWRQPTIWGSVFAVDAGLATPEQARRIAQYCLEHEAMFVFRGQVRHLPKSTFWGRPEPEWVAPPGANKPGS